MRAGSLTKFLPHQLCRPLLTHCLWSWKVWGGSQGLLWNPVLSRSQFPAGAVICDLSTDTCSFPEQPGLLAENELFLSLSHDPPTKMKWIGRNTPSHHRYTMLFSILSLSLSTLHIITKITSCLIKNELLLSYNQSFDIIWDGMDRAIKLHFPICVAVGILWQLLPLRCKPKLLSQTFCNVL